MVNRELSFLAKLLTTMVQWNPHVTADATLNCLSISHFVFQLLMNIELGYSKSLAWGRNSPPIRGDKCIFLAENKGLRLDIQLQTFTVHTEGSKLMIPTEPHHLQKVDDAFFFSSFSLVNSCSNNHKVILSKMDVVGFLSYNEKKEITVTFNLCPPN